MLEAAETKNQETKDQLQAEKENCVEQRKVKDQAQTNLSLAKIKVAELKREKENLRKQISNFNQINTRKGYDVNEFIAEKESLKISNRYLQIF